MEWLKDRKNLPIVVALAVFVLLAAGGLIAFELGAFSGSSNAVASSVPTGPPPPPRGLPPGAPPAGLPPSAEPAAIPARPLSVPVRPSSLSGRPVAALPLKRVAVIKKTNLNPAVGPDPFYLRGGKQIASTQGGTATAGARLPVRDFVGPLDLFQLRPPTPPLPPAIPGISDQVSGRDPAANYRLAGVVTGSGGINAILEVGGDSQTVRPGDSLSDGSRVQNIQTNSITLRTARGSVISLPLSAGSPDQGGGYPYGQPPYGQAGFNGGYNGSGGDNGQ